MRRTNVAKGSASCVLISTVQPNLYRILHIVKLVWELEQYPRNLKLFSYIGFGSCILELNRTIRKERFLMQEHYALAAEK